MMSKRPRRRGFFASARILHAALVILAAAAVLASAGCGASANTVETDDGMEQEVAATDAGRLPESDEGEGESPDPAPAPDEPLEYAAGWLISDVDGIPAGIAVDVLQAPGLDTPARRGGEAVSEEEQAELAASWPPADDGQAIVAFEGRAAAIDPDLLLVNLPDALPQAEFDIVYSYASTSRCAGLDIPGVTGERLPGYADGMQPSAYWGGEPRFVAPCAWRTACKARAACDALAARGYRLLVYDAYRPMTAQLYLADALAAAYEESPEMQEGLGSWGLAWFVADGPSGHNFGTDLDVGLCDGDGNPLPMPSSFDAFDETGHLAGFPINSGDISPESYCEAVLQNEACMALHEAFVGAGFTELASEWWHFGDPEAKEAVQAIAGYSGLDFIAERQ